jgi:hypothetical protein
LQIDERLVAAGVAASWGERGTDWVCANSQGLRAPCDGAGRGDRRQHQRAVADDDMKRIGVVTDELGALADGSAEVTVPRAAIPVAVAIRHDPARHGDRSGRVLERENTRGHAGHWLNPAVTLRWLAGLVAVATVVG